MPSSASPATGWSRLCALALASATGLLFLPEASKHPLVVLALIGLLPGFVFGLVVLDLMGRYFVRLARFRIVRPFLELASLMERLRRMPGLTAVVLAISLVGHAFCAGAFYVLSQQLGLKSDTGRCSRFRRRSSSILRCRFRSAAGALREALSAALFGLVGVAPASGVALSIAYGLLMSAVGLGCGAVALMIQLRRRTLPLRKAAQS